MTHCQRNQGSQHQTRFLKSPANTSRTMHGRKGLMIQCPGVPGIVIQLRLQTIQRTCSSHAMSRTEHVSQCDRPVTMVKLRQAQCAENGEVGSPKYMGWTVWTVSFICDLLTTHNVRSQDVL